MRKKLIVALSVTAVALSGCAFYTLANAESVNAQTLVIEESAIESSYALGSAFRLDEIKGTVNGNSVTAKPRRIIYPDDSVSTNVEATLSVVGKYTVEYAAEYQGKVYMTEESFYVYDDLYSVSTMSDSVSYGVNEYAPEYEGLNVSLLQGSTFTFNPIIDFSKKTGEDLLISFNIQPSTLGAHDFKRLYIDLTDIHDENNKVTIRVAQSPDTGNTQAVSYISAKHGTKDPIGIEKGIKGGKIVGGYYGFASSFSFCGYSYQNNEYSSEGKWQTRLYFDYEKKEIYAKQNAYQSGGSYVISLDEDFDEAWTGFTTGEARLSIYADNYVKNEASFIIDSIYDYDLTQTINENVNTTYPTVDLGEYTAETVPTALVGNKYPLFEANIWERYGLEKMYQSVYYNYRSSTRYAVDCKDGYFLPMEEGLYTIEYACKDRFGQIGLVTIDVNAIKTPSPIVLELAETKTTEGVILGKVPVAEYEIVSGGYGTVDVSVTVKNTVGETVATITDGVFTPQAPGEYQVEYVATDYVGQTTTATYKLTVDTGRVPVYTTEPVLPKYMIKGEKYVLPQLTALDYTTGVQQTVNATISCMGGNLEGDTFTPTGSRAEIVYTAKSSLNESAEKRFSIPIVDVRKGDGIDMTKYFVSSDMSIVAKDLWIELETTADLGVANFVNALIADRFSFLFYAVEGKNSIKELKLTLTDSANAEESVVVCLRNMEGNTTVQVSGAKERKLSAIDLTSSKLVTEVKYDGKLRIGSTAVEIPKYENGELFNGFTSGKIYFTISVESAGEACALAVENISGQAFYDGDLDEMAPMLSIRGDYGGRFEKGETAVLPAIICGDVLSPVTKASVTVESPSGYVTTKDGVLLKKANPFETYSIVLEEYGTYIVTYVLTDGEGNEVETMYFLNVKDSEFPTIDVNVSDGTAKVGDSVTMAKASVSDNLTRGCTISVCVVRSDGQIEYLENGAKYTYKMTGVHKITYIAIDAAGNMATVSYIVTVA